MPDTILVPMDGSDQSHASFEYAVAEYPDAEFIVLHVINPAASGYSADPMGGDYWDEWMEHAEERAQNLFEEVEAIASAKEIAVTTELVTGQPARSIVRFAQENEVDHVVMGSHGRSGISRVLLGSVAETVVRRSPVPVTVVR